jgi:acyl-CoA thioester hydrolase
VPDPDFKFSVTIPVRFADMDAMGHVNNATYLTYFEEARMMYFLNLSNVDMAEAARQLPFILAEATVTFKAPVHAAQQLNVFVRVSAFGTRSFRMEYRIENAATGHLVAEGSTVQVTYDYDKKMTIPVPEKLKQKILEFEHQSTHSSREDIH